MMPGSALAKGTLLAAGTFVGTVIGVGVFGLPYLASRMGLVPLLVLFAILTPLVLIIHLRFASVAEKSTEKQRIPGYVARYLGARWGRVSRFVSCLGLLGSLLAYLVIGGTFLHILFQPFGDMPLELATFLFFLLGSALIIRGTRSVAWVDLVMMVGFFLIVGIFFFLALPKMETSIFRLVDWSEGPAGYGVVLFALWGLSLVPETVELAGRVRSRIRQVLLTGIVAAAIIYLLFTFMVLGVSGHETTPDALTGFLQGFSPWVVVLGGILGILATFTSYIALGITLKKTFQFDMRLTEGSATFLALVLPLGLYLIGLKNFLDVLGLTGALLLGFEGALVLLVAERFSHQKGETEHFRVSTIVLLCVLLAGMFVELWSFLR